jgi:uncharacterized protein (TIGR02391 family)
MFSKKQKQSIYEGIQRNGFHLDDFTFQESAKITIIHIDSSFYWKLYVGHTRVSTKGTEQLLTVEYTPSVQDLVLAPDKPNLIEALDNWDAVLTYLDLWLGFVSGEYGPDLDWTGLERDEKEIAVMPDATPNSLHPLGLMHPLVHQSAGKLFVDGHYPQALLNACTALDKALQQQTGQPADLTGSALMTKVFSPGNPLIRISTVQGEQQGYMFLFNGLVMAIRNHYAHNLTELNSAERALEWLGFVSALCYQVQWASTGAGGSEPAI